MDPQFRYPSAQPGSTPTLESGTLHAWEQLARSGAMSARTGHAERALASYSQALHIAQALLETPALQEQTDACIAALVVTHHSLADLHLDAGAPALAVWHLCTAHDALATLAHNVAHGSQVQAAALRHLRETHSALVCHLREYGADPAIARSLSRTSLVFCTPSNALH